MESMTATDVSVSPTALIGKPLKTPLGEIVEALKRVQTLQGLTDGELEWLATHGEEVCVSAGTLSSAKAILRRRCGCC